MDTEVGFVAAGHNYPHFQRNEYIFDGMNGTIVFLVNDCHVMEKRLVSELQLGWKIIVFALVPDRDFGDTLI